MAQNKPDNLVSSVANVLREKEALASKERNLVSSLNKVLRKMGYEVVKTDGHPKRSVKSGGRRRKRRTTSSVGRRAGRPGTVRTSRRGRPPKST